MAPGPSQKRVRAEDELRRPKKKVKVKRRQAEYHSSSEAEENDGVVVPTASNPAESSAALQAPKSILKQSMIPAYEEADPSESESEGAGDLDEVERNIALNVAQDVESEDEHDDDAAGIQGQHDSASESSDEDAADSDLEATSSATARTKKKRNDPTAFANSISRILSTKLTTSKRPDPVLSRSKSASEITKALSDYKLEQTARKQLRAEKKAALQKGRVTDVLGLETPDVDTGRLQEDEKRLKKTAQRGVVKLFNAVRAAQVRAEEGVRQAREEGVVGRRQREERVNEMSREGFLELISQGGKSAVAT